ncbi:MAG: SH3 domain-containing protein [Aphanothece sp. CMT-3BRIN-NPC111]|jgi:hypothetical protein|nr:SH3 domain-containing protein [Aphanothece sp. CMT-3BRIN-NPC111]
MFYLNQLKALLIALPIASLTFTLSGLPVLAHIQIGSKAQSERIAQNDPDYGIEIQNNTVCSFINASQVNIRKGPGTNYPVITQLNIGDGVRALNREGNWVNIAARVYEGSGNSERYEPLNAWVSNQYINGCSEDKFDMWRE